LVIAIASSAVSVEETVFVTVFVVSFDAVPYYLT
jgi:hypothetical protein